MLNRIKNAAARLLEGLGVNEEAIKLYAKWIVGAPTLVVFILILMLLRPWRRKSNPAGLFPVDSANITSSAAGRRKLAIKAKASSRKGKEDVPDKIKVLRFFFNLFKSQAGAKADAVSQLILTETRPTCPNETYEMRIQQDGEWNARRMSIGLLGQGGGSRSKCFYVIYDSHMVIKLPSDPMTDFAAYKKQIAAEARIVARLAPRECIVPRVAVILKAVHTFKDNDKLSADVLEKHYVHLLKTKPSYLDYLKIGSSFAFFMDLAKHFFLSTTLEEIHSGYENLAQEAIRHPELLWDQHGFVCRYGEETAGVCQDLQEIYYRCEGRLRRLVDEAAIVDDVPTFQLKNWFLLHLAGEQIPPGAQDLPSSLINRANKLLTGVIKANHSLVEQYRMNVRAYMRETHFSQHRTQLENLASNTLDLLAWIGAKGLALRDLKPENLFVAGNPDEYPLFLSDTAKFSIGLIDVETAVVIDAAETEDIPQPQLAGTPLYATPAHLMSNTILAEVYGDLRTVLHLQDWYATIAIIYKIVTGENLFLATARVFPELLDRLKLVDPAGADLVEDVARINRMFWNSAIAEFKEGMARHSRVFARVEVRVPESFLPDIVKALHHDSDQIARSIAAAVADQSFFVSNEKRQYLLDAPAEKIRQMKNKLAPEIENPADRVDQRSQALAFFERLELLKNHLQRKLEAAAALKATGDPIAADQLLEAMFQRVFSFMYPAEWPALTPAKWRGATHLPTDITTYQATM